MPFCVVGKCMQRYKPGEFKDVDSAIKFTFNKTIWSNQMFFGENFDWCIKQNGDV